MPLFHWPARRAESLLLYAALLCGWLVAAPASADDLQDASRMLRQGQHAKALEKINRHLASRPKDAQGRFLKGLILTEQNKSSEAVDVFTRLTQDYPELPEPYNNLAVLYAAQGQYEKARQSLEQSIRTHPSYATAYENLGDVYTKLASKAYDKALQLDSSNSAAKTKLSLVRDLMGGGGAVLNRPTVAPEPARSEPARPEPPRAVPPRIPPSSEPVIAVAPKPVAPRQAVPSAGEAQPAPKAPAANNDAVLEAVHGWAQAWSDKDVKGYLSFYARDFKTPKGEPRGQWETERTRRLMAPKRIDVTVQSPRVMRNAENTATVTFRQDYRSDRFNGSSMKTLTLMRTGGKWFIQQERIGN